MDQTSKIQLDKIGEMFDEGKRFTEEVLKENERLRLIIQNQKLEIKELTRGPNIELKELRARIEILEEDNRLLREDSIVIRKQYNEVDQTNKEYRERYKYIEQQNSSLLNLYVAEQRLHEKLEFIEVIQAIKELTISLIGADAFKICLYDEQTKRLLVLAAEGSPTSIGSIVPMVGPIVNVLKTGSVYIPFISDRKKYDPPLLACIPLKLEEKTRGMLIIQSLMYQKDWFDGSEQELFDLLGGQSMMALCASFSYSQNISQKHSTQWTQLINEMTEAAKQLEDVAFAPAVIW